MKEIESSSAYYDSTINAAIGSFVGFLYTEDFITIANDLLIIIKSRKINKQLNDIKRMKVLNPDVEIWLNTIWFPKAQMVGLKYFAFVVPDDIFGKISMKEANRSAEESFGIEIQYFKDIKDAKNWLISKN